MLVAADEKAPVTYRVEGLETYGNGKAGMSGPGAVALRPARVCPAKTLTVSNLFGDSGTVVFPLGEMTPAMRQELASCFSGSAASH